MGQTEHWSALSLGEGQEMTDNLSPLDLGISPLTAIARRIRRHSLHPQGVSQVLAEAVGRTLGASRCLVLGWDHYTQEFWVKASFCQPATPSLGNRWIPQTTDPWRSLLEHHHPLLLQDTDWQGEQFNALWILPLMHQHQPKAYLCLQFFPPHTPPSPSHTLPFLQELTEQAGTAIAHAYQYQDLKQAKKAAEEASKLKSDFLAGTTHELRTPLNGIIGFLRLILDDMADSEEEKQEFIEEAYQSALLMLNLINDILDLVKIEAGDPNEVALEPVDFFEVLRGVKKIIFPQAQSQGVEFQCHLLPLDGPLWVYGNYRWLLQILLNLVGNALKFTREGTISLTLDIIPRPIHWQGIQKPGLLKVSVTDTGIGVSPEHQAKLFQKFVRLQESGQGAGDGTGLGLVISQKLLDKMGGKVAFFSMGEGLGSTVSFTIPLDQLPTPLIHGP